MNIPLILAHRGASALAPENTLAAFRLARDLGADGIELDVTLSRDGVPVVIHDDTVDRTTDGRGPVRALTVHELKQLDAGRWKGEKYCLERIPLLAEVFDSLADWFAAAGSSQRLRGLANVELKSSLAPQGLEREVVNLIARHGLESRVLVSSFNPLALWRVKALNPRIKRGLLYAPELPVPLSRAWFRLLVAPHALHPEHSMVSQALVNWARKKRLAVHTWTVDESTEALRLAKLGVSGIITNRPDAVRRAVSSEK